MMFCTLYICGKLNVFNQHGRGKSWRLLLGLSPLFAALIVGLSRTCDYHHHWQGKGQLYFKILFKKKLLIIHIIFKILIHLFPDVLAGSLLGVAIAWLCYFQYFPPLAHPNSGFPYSILSTLPKSDSSDPLRKSESLESVSVKWI